jgi:hypothetical protein
MCEETPVYETACGELLIDPEVVCREVDEFLIQFHAARLREDGMLPRDDG